MIKDGTGNFSIRQRFDDSSRNFLVCNHQMLRKQVDERKWVVDHVDNFDRDPGPTIGTDSLLIRLSSL
jgi:hypothetical protein